MVKKEKEVTLGEITETVETPQPVIAEDAATSTDEVRHKAGDKVLVRFFHTGRGVHQVMPCKDEAEAHQFMEGNGGRIVEANDFNPNELIIVH